MSSGLVNGRRVSLSRSCQACIKAKHRCSRQVPKCNRCSKEALICQYDNVPIHPGLSGDEPNACGFSLSTAPYEGYTSDDIAFLLGARLFFRDHPTHPNSRSIFPDTCLRPDFAAQGIDLTLDPATLSFLVCHLRSYPAAFANSHATPFIHAQLYRQHMPKPIRDAWILCNAHSSLNAKGSSSYWSVVESKLSLIGQGTARSTPLHLRLASFHALLLYLILELFHKHRFQHLPATILLANVELLRKWTAELWQIAPASLATMQGSEWQAWAMAESVRRTILTSYLLQGVFNVLSYGVTRHTLFASSLPFDARTWLWDIDNELKWTQNAKASMKELGSLASYREFTDAWQKDDLPIHGTFEALLVAACKGRVAMIAREQSL